MPPEPDSDDTTFRELVIDVLERLDRNGSSALEDACREHPELAAGLRERVGALQSLGLVGQGAPAESANLIGEFRLLEKIGAGGMGVVYRALQASLGREVALKLIRPEVLGFAKSRERFERETEVIARLQHPGIVPIYTVGQDADQPFYAMELVRGCTLEQALRELADRSPADLCGEDLQAAVRSCSPGGEAEDDTGSYLFDGTWEEVCLRVVAQVAEAVEHAHRRGVLHRDIKLGNILITPGGRVMLVDFGLSQIEGEETLTRSGERIGSVHYMSPELLRKGPQHMDARSDVYSLGVTLFRLLTLELPFSGASEVAVMQSILEGRPQRPREHLSGISWEAETVCLVAMDRDPERRYPTAAAFARDLSNALERRPVEARRASLRRRAWRWIERRPGEAAAIALAMLLAVSIPSLIAWFESRAAQRAGESLAQMTAEQERTEEQRRLAEGQRVRAEENYAVALGTVDTLLRQVGEDRLDGIPGMVELRGELARSAEDVYRELQQRQPDDPELARLAAGSQRLQAVTLRSQGRFPEAEAVLKDAAASLEPWLEGGSYELRRVHALCLQNLATFETTAERLAEATAALRALISERPDDLDLRAFLVRSALESTLFDQGLGNHASSLQGMARVESEARALLATDPIGDARTVLAKVLRVHSLMLWNEGRHEQARVKGEESLELYRAVFEGDPTRDDARAGISRTANELGALLALVGLDDESLLYFDEARPELEWLMDAYPGEPEHVHTLGVMHKNRGISLAKLGANEEAVETFELALATFATFERRFPFLGGVDFQYGIVNTNLATALSDLGDFEGALASLDTARRNAQAAHQADPEDQVKASWVGVERMIRGIVLLKMSRPAEAAEVLAEGPGLVAHRVDRVEKILARMVIALQRARASGDEEVLRRTRVAARQGLDSALARGDSGHLKSLRELRELLDLQ